MFSIRSRMLKKRLEKELQACKKTIQHKIILISEKDEFPVVLEVCLVDAQTPVMNANGILERIHDGRFIIEISEEYPWKKPVVRWLTQIFHPNIMPPEEGGYVCTKLLDTWSCSSSIAELINGIEILAANPNPDSPIASESCKKTAEYFKNYWKLKNEIYEAERH